MYPADPGGIFSSDTHRRILGHLSYPTDEYGWSVIALVNRMLPDVGTSVDTEEEMKSLLEDLEANGHARKVSTESGDVWQMTEDGLTALAGPIANEPQPGESPAGPAQVGAATQISNGSAPENSSSVGE